MLILAATAVRNHGANDLALLAPAVAVVAVIIGRASAVFRAALAPQASAGDP